MELTGWSGRLWSTYDPLAMLPFKIQYVSGITAVHELTDWYLKNFRHYARPNPSPRGQYYDFWGGYQASRDIVQPSHSKVV